MASPAPLSLRLGREGLLLLDETAQPRCIARAEAARRAIAETAARDRQTAGLAAEARRLAQDAAYIEEAREVAALIEWHVIPADVLALTLPTDVGRPGTADPTR